MTDTLNISDYAKAADLNEAFIRSHPGVLKLVRQAIKHNWDENRFTLAFQKTDWFKNNASWARGYLIAKAQGGADFEEKQRSTAEYIKQRAVQLGATISDDAVNTLVEAYYMNGWSEKGREVNLDRALAGELPDFDVSHLDFQKGGPQSIIQKLKDTASRNGVKFSDGYYESAAKSVIAQLKTVDDFDMEIRNHAASLFPVFGERIRAGENGSDIASPYMQRMADILELNPNDIKLDNPMILKAIGGVGADGKPTAMSLWDFQKELKKDPRWEYTRNAHQEIGNLVGKIGSMMGFGGAY